MKILFLTSSLEGGGAERVAALLCNAWAEMAINLHLEQHFRGVANVLIHLIKNKLKISC